MSSGDSVRLLVLQLSDVHFRVAGNPIEDRLDALMSAVGSIVPQPSGCMFLLTGDIVWSGDSLEYAVALKFINALLAHLNLLFGPANVSVEMIPGNHDCSLPKEQVEVRKVVVEGSRLILASASPDSGFTTALLTAQAHFQQFYEAVTGRFHAPVETISRSSNFTFSNAIVCVISLNTALLAQRYEKPGSLYVPLALLRRSTELESGSALTICIHHHPDNWLEPNSRREFVRQVEGVAHIIFTGHEHQQDNLWKLSPTGSETAYVQADALQDETFPSKSGFNAVVIDSIAELQHYYHFRWRNNRYSATSDDEQHQLSLQSKQPDRLAPTPRFMASLQEDSFGFTHRARGPIQLSDVFVYPHLSTSKEPLRRRSI